MINSKAHLGTKTQKLLKKINIFRILRSKVFDAHNRLWSNRLRVLLKS